VKNGRIGVSVDIDPDYCRIAENRLQMLRDGTLKTRPIGSRIKEPSPNERTAQIPSEWQGVGISEFV